MWRYYTGVKKQIVNVNGVETLVTMTGPAFAEASAGKKGSDLLCLHGWGASHESFTELRAALEGEPIRIIAPDMPGFGASAEPPIAWTVDDYVDFVEELVTNQELGIRNQEILLLGHSFGGRIAIKLAARQGTLLERGCTRLSIHSSSAPLRTHSLEKSTAESRDINISHLFLCASAGLRQKRYLKREIGHAIAKIGKTCLKIPGIKLIERPAKAVLYKLLRAHDYARASDRMKETMIQVINEDLAPYLTEISAPTDLFWGTEDTMTPLTDGEYMNKKIVQSTLHTFDGVRHRVHRDRSQEIASVIRQRI